MDENTFNTYHCFLSPICSSLSKVKQSLTIETTRRDHGQSLSVVLVYLYMRGILLALGSSAYLSVWRKKGALCVEHLAVFVPSHPHPLLSTVYECGGCLSSQGCGGSWLGCQVLPATGAVSILELAAINGSSRMSRAPNLHRATQLFNAIGQKVHPLILTQDLFSINNATHPEGIMFQAAF